jgi:thiamine transporter ThiT
VYEAKYRSKTIDTAAITTTTTTTITAALMRYVWHWIALGLMVLAG